jgi:hypothetical protein
MSKQEITFPVPGTACIDGRFEVCPDPEQPGLVAFLDTKPGARACAQEWVRVQRIDDGAYVVRCIDGLPGEPGERELIHSEHLGANQEPSPGDGCLVWNSGAGACDRPLTKRERRNPR